MKSERVTQRDLGNALDWSWDSSEGCLRSLVFDKTKAAGELGRRGRRARAFAGLVGIAATAPPRDAEASDKGAPTV